VVYDGLLVWRSGPRPPRNLARKQVAFSPRADVERERIYHCEHCAAEYFSDVENRQPHLYAEGGGLYTYNRTWKTWTHRFFDWEAGQLVTRVLDQATGEWLDE
jgi:hypothetical protein